MEYVRDSDEEGDEGEEAEVQQQVSGWVGVVDLRCALQVHLTCMGHFRSGLAATWLAQSHKHHIHLHIQSASSRVRPEGCL